MQNNHAISQRRALYTSTADVYVLPDTDHVSLGQDHAWDIARRIRVRNTSS